MKNYHIIRFLGAIMTFLLTYTEGGAQGIQTFQSIRLYHPNTQGQYIGLVPPSSITSYNLTLPNTQGSANSLLLNDGNGNLSWNTVSGFAWGLTGNSSTSWANHFLGTTDNVSLRFRTNNAERMILDSVGRLAVGVSSALGRLHIQEPINTVNKFVLSGDNAAPNTKIASILFNRFNYDPTGNAAEIAVWRGNAATEGTIAFSTNPGSATGQQPTERMRITETGNVGIGTTAPAYKLDIDANTGSTGNPLRLQGLQAGATSDSLLSSASGVLKRLAINELGTGNFWKIGGNTEGVLQNLGTTDNFALPFLTNNTERMRITETGNVGIGTTTPSEKLYVAGNIYATGTIVSSDRRFKKNIQPIADPLQKVMAIKGVSYEMRLDEFPTRGFKAGTQIGFIAQDLEKVVPEVVSTQADGYKGVDYERITALLVEAVKQQQQKIEQLEKENNALKNQASDIEALKKQMAEIKALLDKK